MAKPPVPPVPANGTLQVLPVSAHGPVQLLAQTGKIYRLSLPGKGPVPAGFMVLRKGKDLVVLTETGPIVLQGFFGMSKGASVLEWTDPQGETARIASADVDGLKGPNAQMQWTHSESYPFTTNTNPPEVLYAQGDSAALHALASQQSGLPWNATIWQPPTAGSQWGFWWPEDVVQWMQWPVAAPSAAPGLVGLLAVPILAGSGGAAAADEAVLDGLIVAGPVIAGNDLVVKVYNAAGQVIDSASVDGQGRFALKVGAYRGPVLVQVTNGTQQKNDYFDEGTGQSRDLGFELRGSLVIKAAGKYTLNLNPLTELAVQLAGVQGHQLGGRSAADLEAANTQVAQSVGLKNLMTDVPVPVVNADGSSNVNQANVYGWLLAAIAGAEENTPAGTTTAVLQQLLTRLQQSKPLLPTLLDGVWNISGAPGNLPSWVKGIEVLSGQTPEGIQKTGLSIDSVGGDNVLTPSEWQQAVVISGDCASAAAVTVTVGGQAHTATVNGTRWSLTLQPADWQNLPQGSTVVEVTSTVGSKITTVQRGVYVDKTPTVASVTFSAENLPAGTTLHTGDVLRIEVKFTEAMQLDANAQPQFLLDIGGVVKTVALASLQHDTLVFRYTIEAGLLDGQGVSAPANPLQLASSASLSDRTGNSANLAWSAIPHQAAFKVDAVAPTVAITAAKAQMAANEAVTIIFTFSEEVQGFDLSDVLCPNGSLSTLTATSDPKVYTALFTAKTALTGVTADLQVQAGRYTDLAGNTGTASPKFTGLAIDTVTPVLTSLTADKSLLKIGDLVNITFTFSEDVAPLLPSDIATTGLSLVAGSLQPLSGKQWTAQFQVSAGAQTVALALQHFTDVAGNAGNGAALSGLQLDAVAPQISAITFSSPGSAGPWLKAGDVLQIDVTMSEPVVLGNVGQLRFVLDIGGTPKTANLDTGRSTATTLVFRYTIEAGLVDTQGISAPASPLLLSGGSTLTDTAGNPANLAWNATGPQTGLKVDALAPTVAITAAKPKIAANEAVTITFTFSEEVQGFDLSDVLCPNGSLSTLTATSDPKVYTAVFTANPGLTSVTADLQVKAGSYTDLAGNTGMASPTFTGLAIDTQPPGLTITSNKLAVKGAGDTITVTFTFTEDVVGFTDGDVTPQGLDLVTGTFTGTGKVYTAQYKVQANATGVGLTVAAASYQDGFGNLGISGQLPVLPVDTSHPSVKSMALLSGAHNGWLKAGDTVQAVVTFSEAVLVSGAPTLALNIGGTLVQASYKSGGTGLQGSTALVFEYPVGSNVNDIDGISIDDDALSLLTANDTITDLAGNAVVTDTTHTTQAESTGVADNPAYKVDTLAPTVTPASKASNLNINGGEAGALVGTVVESCNAGNGYLVSVTSSNGGYFTSSSTGASPVAYSVNFDNNVGNMSTGVTATRNTPQSSRESNLVVSFQGNSSAAAGEYSDTINITLAAR